MNPLKIAAGFIPMVAFSLLATLIPAGWAALVGVVVAIVITALTARNGIKSMPVAQALILLAIATLAFTGGGATDHALVKYGPALQAVLLGFFMVTTAGTTPFTAQDARATVPREVWHSRRFLEVNQQISTAWGIAVLFLGLCHLAGAEIPVTGPQLALRLAVNWVLPLVAFWRAAAYTQSTAAQAREEAQERTGR